MSYTSLSIPQIIHILRVAQSTLQLQLSTKNRGCNSYSIRQGRGLVLGHKRSIAPLPKMLTHVGDLHKEEEALKIRPIRERLEPYLEGPTKSEIVDARETNTPVKQKLHLMPWYKPQAAAPRGALRKNQKTSSLLGLTQAGCITLTKTP